MKFFDIFKPATFNKEGVAKPQLRGANPTAPTLTPEEKKTAINAKIAAITASLPSKVAKG